MGRGILSACTRNNVRINGAGQRAMMFAHGFGCDQNMWRLVAPAFERDFRTVLFDYVGVGGADISAYDPICPRSRPARFCCNAART
jgi:sigma-B regulation protein RsbQ